MADSFHRGRVFLAFDTVANAPTDGFGVLRPRTVEYRVPNAGNAGTEETAVPHVRKIVWLVLTSVAVIAGAAASLPGITPLSARQLSEAAAARTSIVELRKLYDAGAVIVLDVRSADAYRQGHIPGAILVPLETMSARAAEWKSAAKPIVTYCS